ncbi:MAG TPA: ABC transporter substrate-binding protein, partial [Burkholderiales bacterium]|nr:ABC transporter substrate-binding protein [Burkholderiales bacterium]
MDRRLALKTLGLLCAPGVRATAFAQAPARAWRVGFLGSANAPANGLPPAPLRRGLAGLGYVEGRDVVYYGRWADAKFDRLGALAGELVQLGADVIVVLGWQAADAARRATSSIPIVLTGVGDAVESRLVASLAHPGGNLTGMSDVESVLSSKRLQLLKQTVPHASRIAVLWNQNDVAMTLRYRRIDEAARSLGVMVVGLGVREPD